VEAGVVIFLFLVLAIPLVVTLGVAQNKCERERAAEQQRKWAEQQRQVAAAQAERERLAAKQRHARQLSRWPPGTTLDSDVANIDGIIPQVAAQNEKIESDVRQLNDLLHDGLRYPKEAEPTAFYLAGDPKGHQ
jgi:hypothetical protein